MHIQIQREDFLKPLSQVVGATERRQSLPILSNVLLKLDDQALTCVGTDLEIEVVARHTGVKGDAGALTVPARKLLDICRALPPEAKIDLRQEKDKAVIKSGRSRFSLLTLPASDFPVLETADWEESLKLPQSAVKALLEKTHFCMAQQDVRYFLNGLLLDLADNQLKAVATDGHRLAINELVLAAPVRNSRQAIVPRKGVQELTRFLASGSDEVEIQLATNHLRANLSDLTFTCKLIDGRFPDYNRVIPPSHPRHIRIPRAALHDMLGRVAILANEKYRGIRFSLRPGALTIIAHNPEQEEAQEEMPAPYRGEDMEIGFNASYLSDALAAIETEEVEVGLTDTNSSCTLHAPDDQKLRYVIMPMRL
jgi:DNA polymerase-3 subunit beta